MLTNFEVAYDPGDPARRNPCLARYGVLVGDTSGCWAQIFFWFETERERGQYILSRLPESITDDVVKAEKLRRLREDICGLGHLNWQAILRQYNEFGAGLARISWIGEFQELAMADTQLAVDVRLEFQGSEERIPAHQFEAFARCLFGWWG